MNKNEYPILEFDESCIAFIEPYMIKEQTKISEYCILCFFKDVLDKLYKDGVTRIISSLNSESGITNIYEVNFNEKKIAVFNPGLGAPQASILLEKAIFLGGKKFIACGGAGVLDSNFKVGHVIIPQVAIRDEGTSYHYLPPGREVEASKDGILAIEKVLNRNKIKYVLGKTWTTDGMFRETLDKIQLRKSEGCITVEMECAAFFAVAKFRGVTFAQLLYSGDDLSSEKWSSRNWKEATQMREKIFWLSVESCLEL